MTKPDAILIAGPTASGKSRLAFEVARLVGGEIVNTDSMQIYDVLRVLTARPSKQDEAAAPHHLYGHISPTEDFSVAKWLEQAKTVFREIAGRGAVPVFAGGTGLYFKALEAGLANVPEIPDDIREPIRKALKEEGSEALHRQLAAANAEGGAALRPSDGQRIARALEVVKATGRPLRAFQNEAQSEAMLNGLNVRKILLMPERALLHERINARTEAMMEQGTLEEVKALLALDLPASATAMQAIGVKPLSAHLAGDLALDEAIERTQAATRQYAKRQSTWFRGQHGDDWLHAETAEEALEQLSG